MQGEENEDQPSCKNKPTTMELPTGIFNYYRLPVLLGLALITFENAKNTRLLFLNRIVVCLCDIYRNYSTFSRLLSSHQWPFDSLWDL